MSESPESTAKVVEAIWRIESAKVIGALTRHVGDVGLAEDLAHDALVAALEQWSRSGVPVKPGAWLVTVAKRRFIDGLRRTAVFSSKQDAIYRQAESCQQSTATDFEVVEEQIEDDVLRLVFMACHPVISRDARVALTLKLVAGLTVSEIARAFLVGETTVSQRIVRAKRTLAEARVSFELPPPEQLHERLESVLEVIYLVFNEGYAASSGSEWTRPEFCREALR